MEVYASGQRRDVQVQQLADDMHELREDHGARIADLEKQTGAIQDIFRRGRWTLNGIVATLAVFGAIVGLLIYRRESLAEFTQWIATTLSEGGKE